MDENATVQTESVADTDATTDSIESLSDVVDPWEALEKELNVIDPDDELANNQDNADQQKPDKQTETKAEDKSQDEETPKSDPTFTLKHLGEEKTVTADEMKALAQKGMDYDRIKNRNDEADKMATWLADIAKDDGMSVSDFKERIDNMRDEAKIAALFEANKDKGWTPEFAREKYLLDKAQKEFNAKLDAESKKQTDADAETRKAAEKRETEIKEFSAAHSDIAVDKIPAEVWDAVKAGKSLLNAYDAWDIKQEKARLEAEKKNLENKTKSTGSKQSAGNKTAVDPYVASWYDD
jgi:hypothetical protein